MAEYLDNIFTDDDLASNEFLDSINEEISDITGYQASKKKDKEQDDKNKNDEEQIDPLLDVIPKESTPKGTQTWEDPDDIVKYWDLDKEAWRSFRWEQFIDLL